jgi:hypothetical protein
MKYKQYCLYLIFTLLVSSLNVKAQSSFTEYADSTQILLVFDDEKDTATINALKLELQAIELGVTAFTRVHLWQVPVETIGAYGGPSQVLNHARGKPRVKGGDVNYSVPLILNLGNDDDDDNDYSQPQGPLCYSNNLFRCTAGPTSVKMAFLDTGFDGEPTGLRSVWLPNHPFFNNRPLRNLDEAGKPLNIDNDLNGLMDDVKGWDFHFNDNLPKDDNGHGSHTAGLAALKLSSNTDAKRNKILVLKTHNQLGEGSMWQLVQALDYAIYNNIEIVNLSLGYLSPVDPSGKLSVMQYLMEFAKTYKGTLFVAAAGNESANIDEPVTLIDGTLANYYPAALPNDNLIVVAAADCNNELASFSNYGNVNVDIAAPGIDIYSALLDGTFGYLTGTSMAAPHVTAAAALAGSRLNTFNWKKIKSDLLTKSIPSPNLSQFVASGSMLTFCNNYTSTNNPLLVVAKADKVLCYDSTSTLSATATGGVAPYSYIWSNGNSGPNIIVEQAGNYTVTVTDAIGTTATETINLFGASAPFAQINVGQFNCGDECTTLEITNIQQGASYLWSNGDKSSSITVCPNNTSVYSVLTTTPNGCSTITEIAVTNPQPHLPTLKDTLICPCSTAILNATAQGAAGPFSYNWSPGNNTTASVSAYLTSGNATYTVSMSDTAGCNISKAATVTTRCFAPTAIATNYNPQNQTSTFTWQDGPCSIKRWQIRWRCNSTGPWNLVQITDTSANSFTFPHASNCTPQWQVRNRCLDNTFSTWSSIGTQKLAETESETETSDESVSVELYPNPATNLINLKWSENLNDDQVVVYNMLGEKVIQQDININADFTTINIDALTPGIYIVNCGTFSKSFSKH